MVTSYSDYYESSGLLHGFMAVIMGTRLDALLLGSDRSSGEKAWHEIEAEVVRLDAMLNRFDPRSEISQLNEGAARKPMKVNDELWAILKDCKRYHRLTYGYFDISLSDFSKVILSDVDHTAFFAADDICLDLGGYAKGYALDKIRLLLIGRGIKQALVNFGNSSVLGLGKHPYGDYWSVGIENPFSAGEMLHEAKLADTSMSTSGNMPTHPRHIVNPATQAFVTDRKIVSVVTDSATDAEVLTTSLMIAGAEEAEAIKALFNIKGFYERILPSDNRETV